MSFLASPFSPLELQRTWLLVMQRVYAVKFSLFWRIYIFRIIFNLLRLLAVVSNCIGD
jgi:hypothetical protein